MKSIVSLLLTGTNSLDKIEEEQEDEDEEEEEDEQSSKNLASTTISEPNVMVLGPDHPKMARFQAALTAHLKKQIEMSAMELRHLENDLKMKKYLHINQS